MAIFELRQYRINEGLRDRWVTFMDEVVIPFQVQRGIIIAGTWVHATESDHYVWMRRFETEEERTALCARVYSDPLWIQDVKPHVDRMLNISHVAVTDLIPTSKSIIR